MSVLLYVLGVVIFALGVGASIAWHELGHLVPAKRFGVRCTQYMIGFGPTLFSRKRGDTEYGVKAIPLGGYVRMIGMFPPRPTDAPGTLRGSSTGRFSQLVDEAREASQDELQPGDENRVFYKLPWWQKVIVMLGGPTMNLILAAAVMTGIVTLYGLPTVTGAKVSSVYQCVSTTAAAAPAKECPAAANQTPAYRAGLKPGDQFVAVNGTEISSPAQLSAAIRDRADQATTIVVKRDGRDVTVTATPITNTLPVYDDKGQPVIGSDGKPLTHETGFLGIDLGAVSAVQRQSVTAAPGVVWEQVAGTAGLVVKIPQKMVGVAQAAFGDEERDLEGPISIVGVGRIAGEVTSGDVPGLPTDPVGIMVLLLQLLVGLNIALFVFNLIPLLPLDGGHVVGAMWEGLKRGTAKLLHRPDPGYVDVAKGLPIAYAMSIALIVMSSLLIYADIVRPIDLGG